MVVNVMTNPAVRLAVGTTDGLGLSWWFRHLGTGAQLTLKPVDPVFQPVLLRRFMAAGPSIAPGRGLHTMLEFSTDELELIGFSEKDISEMFVLL